MAVVAIVFGLVWVPQYDVVFSGFSGSHFRSLILAVCFLPPGRHGRGHQEEDRGQVRPGQGGAVQAVVSGVHICFLASGLLLLSLVFVA